MSPLPGRNGGTARATMGTGRAIAVLAVWAVAVAVAVAVAALLAGAWAHIVIDAFNHGWGWAD